MNNFTISNCIDISCEEDIKIFIDNKFKDLGLKEEFPNLLIKEDILKILDKYCTVLYYPVSDKKNNGFHITDIPCGKEIKNFVFINTAQTIEKQIFTAAHELGHIWEVDEYLIKKRNLSDSPSLRENIISRFAAILLMPKDIFINYFQNEKEKYIKDETITILDMYRIIVSLMSYFFVPIKSVILRMAELKLISYDSTAKLLLGEGSIKEAEIEHVIKILLRYYGCDKFITPTNKKWIDGLAELLDEAEKKDKIPASKIQMLRELFELKKSSIPHQMANTVDIP